MTPRRKRMVLVSVMVVGIGGAAALVFKAFETNMLFFFSPSQVAAGEAPQDRSFRLGGLVVDGSVQRETGSMKVAFVLTDTLENIPVEFDGILPDLFREGQGIVAQGKLIGDGTFVASEVLAKHDENYMPPEVEASLAKAGVTMPHNNKKP